jgi:hypothetical protein
MEEMICISFRNLMLPLHTTFIPMNSDRMELQQPEGSRALYVRGTGISCIKYGICEFKADLRLYNFNPE